MNSHLPLKSATDREIDLRELKSLMLSILQDIDRFCRTHGIRYYLAYGTLIGAVRHKGYIPWDDDIDICMPRPDYMRFMQQYQHPYYKAYCAETTPGWDHFIAKVCDERTIIDEGHGDLCGVYVDVFPLDGLPDTEKGIKAHYRKVMSLLRIWSSLHYTQKLHLKKGNGLGKNIKILTSKILGLFYSSKKALKRVLKEKMKYPYEISDYVGSMTCGDWSVPRDHIEMIDGEFEGMRFIIPKNYDEWLTAIYGDYMQLPPVEQRVSNHGFKAYWK